MLQKNELSNFHFAISQLLQIESSEFVRLPPMIMELDTITLMIRVEEAEILTKWKFESSGFFASPFISTNMHWNFIIFVLVWFLVKPKSICFETKSRFVINPNSTAICLNLHQWYILSEVNNHELYFLYV